MLQQFYFVEFRGAAEGDQWETYKNRRGVLACYGNYGTACDALRTGKPVKIKWVPYKRGGLK